MWGCAVTTNISNRRIIYTQALASGGLDPATTAWVAAVVAAGGTVSGPRQTVIDTFIKAVKAAGLWTTLDRYWLLASEDTFGAAIDMVNLQSMTVHGTPTFTANKGYAAASGTSFVDTNFVPFTSGVNYTLNSAVFGGHVNTARSTGANAAEFGCSDATFTNVCNLQGFSSIPDVRFRINQGSDSVFTAGSSTRGSWIGARTASNATALYFNGSTSSPGGTDTVASNALPNASFYLSALNQGGSIVSQDTDQISTFFVGGGWNSTQASNFNSCQATMLTSIGVLP
jgi:hypothetical protein